MQTSYDSPSHSITIEHGGHTISIPVSGSIDLNVLSRMIKSAGWNVTNPFTGFLTITRFDGGTWTVMADDLMGSPANFVQFLNKSCLLSDWTDTIKRITRFD